MSQSEPDMRLARAEAAAWLARLRADDCTPEDEAAFRNWLSADPTNASAFDAANSVWDCAGGLDRDQRGTVPAGRGVSRRRLMQALGGAVALGGGFFALAEYAEAGVYETDIGERKHISLSDGTELMLDTATRLRVRFNDMRRCVELQYGRVDFRVSLDARQRPFIVSAGDEVVAGGRSVFDVSCNSGQVAVVLIQGHAAIRSADGAIRAPRVLSRGERLTTCAGSGPVLDKPNLTPLLAWQTGEAIFENSSLADAIAEMNRYSTVKLSIDDARILQLKVSGVYHVGDNISFARSLVTLLPVEAREAGDRIELSGNDSRM